MAKMGYETVEKITGREEMKCESCGEEFNGEEISYEDVFRFGADTCQACINIIMEQSRIMAEEIRSGKEKEKSQKQKSRRKKRIKFSKSESDRIATEILGDILKNWNK